MATHLTREHAYELVLEKIGPGNLLKHILAVEAGMRGMAKRLSEDVDHWGLVGLVHDLDYNETKDNHPRHTYVTREWLEQYDNLTESDWQAIHAHPGHVACSTKLDWSLYAVDPTTGFLVACALMHPDKKLASIDTEFMLRRFKEKRFAAGATRENIEACTNVGIELPDFLMLVRDSMLSISNELGL